MTLAPLLNASAVIQLHVLAAVTALGLGIAQFALTKGTALHRLLGWFWVGLMAVTALSSFGITGVNAIGHWSWIHLLSVYVLFALFMAVRAARRGRIRSHRGWMISLFAGALVITGAFTLLPGRIMGAVVLGW